MIYILVIREESIGDFVAGITTSREVSDEWENQEAVAYDFVSWPMNKNELADSSLWPTGLDDIHNKFKRLMENRNE